MVQTYVQLKTETLAILQDAGSVVFTGTELDYAMAHALREIASISPYVVRETFTIEGRYGTASTTAAATASALVDATKSQFLSTDVGKEVYNSTDKTYALITAYVSTSQVTLSKDIMAVNENYQLFNSGCRNNKQVNIQNTTDYIDVIKGEYPTMSLPRNFRNVSVEGDILTLDMTKEPDDTDPAQTDANREVYIYFAKRHKLSQLTDFAAAVSNSAGYAAGATTIAMSGLQTGGTIEVDQEFTVANVRGMYRATSAVAFTAGTAAVVFWPGLESALAGSGAAVTFKQSTLTPRLEPIFANWVAGKSAVNKTNLMNIEISNAILAASAATAAITLVADRVLAATGDIVKGRTATQAGTVAAGSALTEIGYINAEIDKAATTLIAGSALLNSVPVGGGAPEYMNQAIADISAGRGFMSAGQGFLQLAQVDGAMANTYLSSAARELQAANVDLNAGITNLRLLTARLSIASSGRLLQAWGQAKLAEAKSDLRRLVGYPTSQGYSKD